MMTVIHDCSPDASVRRMWLPSPKLIPPNLAPCLMDDSCERIVASPSPSSIVGPWYAKRLKSENNTLQMLRPGCQCRCHGTKKKKKVWGPKNPPEKKRRPAVESPLPDWAQPISTHFSALSLYLIAIWLIGLVNTLADLCAIAIHIGMERLDIRKSIGLRFWLIS